MKTQTTAVACFVAALSGAPILAQTGGMTAKEQANVRLVQEWTREVFQERHAELGASKYMAENYITHNINAPSGRQAFATYMTNAFKDPAGPALDARTVGAPLVRPNPANPLPPSVVFAKGDFVITVNYREAADPADPSKTYRYTSYGATYVENGKMKEHWDYSLKVKGRPMGGGPDGIDHDKVRFDFTPQERKNLEIANVLFKDILQYGHTELAEKVMAQTYIQHNPNIATGRDAFVAFFSQLRKPEPIKPEWKDKPELTIASGPYVFYIFKRLEKDPDDPTKTYPAYWFDMVRVENGLVQEHWDSAMKNPPAR